MNPRAIRDLSRQLASERRARRKAVRHENLWCGVPISQLNDNERAEFSDWLRGQSRIVGAFASGLSYV